MDNSITISVIVPVYNVETYLRKCIDSLLAQTFAPLEIIIVDDGSTDNSGIIADEYAQSFPHKIKTLHKSNGGLGSARNYGLGCTRGEYVGFVDSDDWVRPEMYRELYDKAKQEDLDIVLFDFYEFFDGEDSGWLHECFASTGKPKKPEDYIRYSTAGICPSACSKLYRKDLFTILQFGDHWYEDLATNPVLLSYAAKIGYVDTDYYCYRLRRGSIIHSALDDIRNLAVTKAWDRVLEYANPKYSEEIVYAVYRSISHFIDVRPAFIDEFLDYLKSKKELFSGNSYIADEIAKGKLRDLFRIKTIPQKLHYCWFGGGPMTELHTSCIKSWQKYAPDYEIIRWDETNCDITENQYVQEAYKAKKWAFVADYFRIKALYEQGGIYLDTDTELKKPLHALRKNEAFFAFETDIFVHAGIFGVVSRHPIVANLLATYKDDHFIMKDGAANTEFTIPKRLTELLSSQYALKRNGQLQTLGDIVVYPPNMLTIDVFDGQNIAEHHYEASWLDEQAAGEQYKGYVLRNYFAVMYGKNRGAAVSAGLFARIRAVYLCLNTLLTALENSRLRKLVFPIRKVIFQAKKAVKKVLGH